MDGMELTPFTTNAIINYNSFLALRRPLCPPGNEQFISERVLENSLGLEFWTIGGNGESFI